MKKTTSPATTGLIKRIMTSLSKKTDELRTRIMIFFLLHRNNNFLLRPLNVSTSSRYYHRHQRCRTTTTKCEEVEGNYVGGEEDDYGGVDETEMMIKVANDNKREYVMWVNEDRRRGSSGGTEMEITIDYVPKKAVDYTTATQGEVSTITQEHAHNQPHAATDHLTDTLFNQSEEEMKQQVEFSTPDDDPDRGDDEEEDIDQAADLFIQRFRRQIQLQKQLSLDRHTHMVHQMVARS